MICTYAVYRMKINIRNINVIGTWKQNNQTAYIKIGNMFYIYMYSLPQMSANQSETCGSGINTIK